MVRIPVLPNSAGYSIASMLQGATSQTAQMDARYSALKFTIQQSRLLRQPDQQEYAKQITAFTQAAKTLQTTANVAANPSLVNNKYVSSTDKAVAGNAKTAARSGVYDVSIAQTAAGQRNSSRSVTGEAFGALAPGIYTFGITVGSAPEKQVTFSISAADNNKQVLGKIAGAVNRAAAGANAEVKTANGSSYLTIAAKQTGAANTLAIRDITGSAVSALQLDNKTQDAADAIYAVNGVNYQSSGNSVLLDNGNVTLELQGVTAGTAKVTVGRDDGQAAAAVKDAVSAYNQLNEVLRGTDNVAAFAGRMLDRMARRDFSALGVSADAQTGALKVDEGKLRQAVSDSPERVQRLLSGPGGLGRQLGTIAAAFLDVPAAEVVKPADALSVMAYSFRSSQDNLMGRGILLNLLI